MTKNLRLGILGMSEGNGHPYSWAAIFNGYNPEMMANCPFPVIPEYLAKQSFPEDAISDAKVTHIWTQDRRISERIARASLIERVVTDYRDMVGQVDAILLARDDAENHVEMSQPFLDAGLPVFIDKPIALNRRELATIFDREQFPGQVFSCSALRFAREMQLNLSDRNELGKIRHAYATVPKSWKTYAAHIIEPVLLAIGDQGLLEQVDVTKIDDKSLVTTTWQSGVSAIFATLGKTVCPLGMTLYGEKSFKEYVFHNTFAAFKASLQAFIDGVRSRQCMIRLQDIKAIVEIIERGAA